MDSFKPKKKVKKKIDFQKKKSRKVVFFGFGTFGLCIQYV